MVARFLDNSFADRYLTTVGVKIGKKNLTINDIDVSLILWDLAGEDDFHSVQSSYVRGAAGYLLVIDGLRRQTLDTAIMLHEQIETALGKIPFIVAVNKADTHDQWTVTPADIQSLADRGWKVLLTNAKLGQGVQDAFQWLTEQVLNLSPPTGGGFMSDPIFPLMLSHLDVLLFEHRPGGLAVVGELPHWAASLLHGQTFLERDTPFPFLTDFLTEATTFWASGSAGS